MNVLGGAELPPNPTDDNIYVLNPRRYDSDFYRRRTDCNVGWISRDEQDILQGKTVGISGCGGMGGLVAEILLRMGVGTIKIADVGQFGVSDLNRQFAATRGTIGASKAFATADALRAICDDSTLMVYPRGINEGDVNHFLDGCDLVLDESEFWAVATRILLHQRARARNIPVINGSTVGFGTRLFLFTPQGTPIEKCLQMTYETARELERKAVAGTLTPQERMRVIGTVALGLLPELPTYSPRTEPCGHPAAARKRLAEEGIAPILASNPPMAAGFLANHAVLQLLKASGIKRQVIAPPDPPGYLYFDSALMQAKVRQGGWLLRLQHKLKMRMLASAATQLKKAA